MDDKEWQSILIDQLTSLGWKNDCNDDTTLGFSYVDPIGDKWIRDYDKRSRVFVYYQGNQRPCPLDIVRK